MADHLMDAAKDLRRLQDEKAKLAQALKNAIGRNNQLEAELANAQRKPLTDQEIDALDSLPFYPSDADVIAFARRIEQAHGIK